MKSDPNNEDEFVVFPSLIRNILFSVVCVGFSAYLIQLAHTDRMEIPAAYLVTLILTAGSIILLSAHFPGASHLKLTKDGFEIRELYKSRLFPWDEVATFVARRRFMGTTVEFMYLHPEIGQAVEESLPTGYAISAADLLQTMNAWRDKYADN